MKTNHQFRIEHDLLGELEVPTEAYFGVHTVRAVLNYNISHSKISDNPTMVKALAYTKRLVL